MKWRECGIVLLLCVGASMSADILMVTMGASKSHKIPFLELAKGLIARHHNITFLNGFPADFKMNGLQEITPAGLVNYIANFSNYDLVGGRMSGRQPIPIWDSVCSFFEACDALLGDAETESFMKLKFDLAILDGAYPDCALGLLHQHKMPIMFLSTVGFFTRSLSESGNPSSYATNPCIVSPFADDMNLLERVVNTFYHLSLEAVYQTAMHMVHQVLRNRLGAHVPHPNEMVKNVSFILQNGHAVLTSPRPLNPNIVEVACIHCRPAKPLPQDLEDFIASSGESGFIYLSMGSFVNTANMPDSLSRLLLKTFALLPYHVLWKYDGSADELKNLTANVKIAQWLPQQDILGHPKLRAFVTHGGLLSLFETVYHGVPVVTMPVCCDNNANSARAEADGYAIKLELGSLNADILNKSIQAIINNPQYRKAVRYRQKLLLDQRTTPLETAVYWTEYVLRHKGAPHLQSPARNLNWLQYYLLDVAAIYLGCLCLIIFLAVRLLLSIKAVFIYVLSSHSHKKDKQS